jgi:hypothetical protein
MRKYDGSTHQLFADFRREVVKAYDIIEFEKLIKFGGARGGAVG